MSIFDQRGQVVFGGQSNVQNMTVRAGDSIELLLASTRNATYSGVDIGTVTAHLGKARDAANRGDATTAKTWLHRALQAAGPAAELAAAITAIVSSISDVT